MKVLLIAVLSVVSSLASAVELKDATNSQLINELDRRLSGGSSTGGGSRAIYSCDSSARLNMDLFGPSGDMNRKDIYIGDSNRCEQISADLSRHKANISSMQIIGVCDSSARLYRFQLLPSGQWGKTSDIYIGDMTKCTAQEKQINTSN